MKPINFRSMITTFCLFVALFTQVSEARIIGMVGESYEGDEKVKIELAGSKADPQLKITTYSTEANPVEAVLGSVFLNEEGEPNAFLNKGESSALMITLHQKPMFDESDFFNVYHYPEEDREQKLKEHNEAMEKKYVLAERTTILSIRDDIVKPSIKPEYVEEVVEMILSSTTFIVFQELKEGDYDTGLKYVSLQDSGARYVGDVVYETK